MVWEARCQLDHEEGDVVIGASYLLGWKAMPLALEDLDSNYKDTLDMLIAKIP